MKKSSIVHHDLLSVVEEMPDELAGVFVKALLAIMRGEQYETDNFALKMALHPFRSQLERDHEKYEKRCERNRANGAKGGRPSKEEANPKNPDGFQETHRNPPKPKKADNDSDNDNDNENDKEKKKDIVTASPAPRIPYSKIISFLNEKTGSDFKPGRKDTKGFIRARWNEGFREDDFYLVIEFKFDEWGGDEKMCPYLRPQTLFSNKFESYLQAAKSNRKETTLVPPEAWAAHRQRRATLQ